MTLELPCWSQVGLLSIAQGGATHVLDYRKHAGLDLLSLLADHARTGPEAMRFWLPVLEMRAAIATDMARLCALRAGRDVRDDLLAIAKEMTTAHSDQQLYALEVRFWNRVLDGCDNVAYRLAMNSMLKGAFALAEAAQTWSAHEARASDFRQPIARAIAKGDDAAERLTRNAMRAVVESFAASLRASDAANRPSSARVETKRKPSRAARTKRSAR